MATATKAAPAKKVAAKKQAAPQKPQAKKAAAEATPPKKAAAATVDVKDHHLNMDREFAEKVRTLRDDQGKKWDEIADDTGSSTGKCILAYMWITLGAKDKVKGTYEERRQAIPRLREEGYSWGQISVRVDLPETRVRLDYEALTGISTRGLNLGRGGLWPRDGEPPAKKVKAEKAAPPKEKKVATAKGGKALTDMTFDELKARIEGKIIQVNRNGKSVGIQVRTVKSLKDGIVDLVNAKNGSSTTVRQSDIQRVSK